jgi:hypothetical protein
MCVGGKNQSTKNKQSAKHNNKVYFNIGTCDDTPPNSLIDSIASLKVKNNERIRSWGMPLGL